MNKKSILFVLLILLVFGILVVFVFDVNCVFKTITGLPCPGCGLTRGFRELFSFHILKAESYNILTIPIFLTLIVLFILIATDLFTKNSNTERVLKSFSKHYILIIIVICISWIINIIRGI